MNRRNTLKALGFTALLGLGPEATVADDDDDDRDGGDDREGGGNPGRVATYNGKKTLTASGLGGFDQVLLYLADGEPTPGWDGVEEAERFQRDIMARSTEEVVADRNAAVEFFDDRFGLDFPDADENTVFDVVDTQSGIDATLRPQMLDPGTGYTAYVVSGRAMPNNHGDGTTNTDTESTGKVRDGGWWATINEDTELGGDYGDGGPSDVTAGTIVLFGDYNIRMGDREPPIVIHYDSEHPVAPAGRIPRAFNCDLSHEEWGEGQVHGVSGGTMMGGIRNVLTFPPMLDG